MVCRLKCFCSGKNIRKKCTFPRFCRSKIVKNDDLRVFHAKDYLFSISAARLKIFYLKKYRIFHFFYSGNNIGKSWRGPHVFTAASSTIPLILLPLQFFAKSPKKWQNIKNPFVLRSEISVFLILLPLQILRFSRRAIFRSPGAPGHFYPTPQNPFGKPSKFAAAIIWEKHVFL